MPKTKVGKTRAVRPMFDVDYVLDVKLAPKTAATLAYVQRVAKLARGDAAIAKVLRLFYKRLSDCGFEIVPGKPKRRLASGAHKCPALIKLSKDVLASAATLRTLARDRGLGVDR